MLTKGCNDSCSTSRTRTVARKWEKNAGLPRNSCQQCNHPGVCADSATTLLNAKRVASRMSETCTLEWERGTPPGQGRSGRGGERSGAEPGARGGAAAPLKYKRILQMCFIMRSGHVLAAFWDEELRNALAMSFTLTITRSTRPYRICSSILFTRTAAHPQHHPNTLYTDTNYRATHTRRRFSDLRLQHLQAIYPG